MIHTLSVEVNLESSRFLYHIELDYKKEGKVVAGGAAKRQFSSIRMGCALLKSVEVVNIRAGCIVTAPLAVVVFNDFPNIQHIFAFAVLILAFIANYAGIRLDVFNIGRLSAPITFCWHDRNLQSSEISNLELIHPILNLAVAGVGQAYCFIFLSFPAKGIAADQFSDVNE